MFGGDRERGGRSVREEREKREEEETVSPAARHRRRRHIDHLSLSGSSRLEAFGTVFSLSFRSMTDRHNSSVESATKIGEKEREDAEKGRRRNDAFRRWMEKNHPRKKIKARILPLCSSLLTEFATSSSSSSTRRRGAEPPLGPGAGAVSSMLDEEKRERKRAKRGTREMNSRRSFFFFFVL